MATAQIKTPAPNAKEIVGPSGDKHNVPISTKVPPGWRETKTLTLTQAPAPVKFATLTGPGGKGEAVIAGSTRSKELFSQGYALGTKTPSDPAAAGVANQANSSQVSAGTTKYVMDGGKFYFVKFNDDPNGSDRVWLLNVAKGTYQPVLSPAALTALKGKGIDPTVLTVSTKVLTDPANPQFSGTFLSKQYAVQNDGTVPALPPQYANAPDKEIPGAGATDQLTGKIYGKSPADPETATAMATKFDKFVSWMGSVGGISGGTMKKIRNEDGTYTAYGKQAFNAMLYGGYFFSDIWRDVKAQDIGLGTQGFSRTTDRSSFINTPEGTAAVANAALAPTGEIALQFDNFGDLTIKGAPDSAWSIDSGATGAVKTPQDLDKARQVEAAYWDAYNRVLNATTAVEHQAAKADFDRLNKSVEKNYGVKLSSNAQTAWSQIQSIRSSAEQAGVSGTGYERGLIDEATRKAQLQDELTRQGKATDEETNTLNYLRKSATPDEVKAQIAKWDAEDAAKGLNPDQYRSVKFGLKASSSQLSDYSLDNLRKMYPVLTDEELKKVQGQYIDANGNIVSEATSKQNQALTKSVTSQLTSGQAAIQREQAIKSEQGIASLQAATSAPAVPSASQMTSTSKPPELPTNPSAPTDLNKPIEVEKPKENPVGTALNQTAPATPTTATPPTGATYISDPKQLQGLKETQIWRDPNSKKIYKR